MVEGNFLGDCGHTPESKLRLARVTTFGISLFGRDAVCGCTPSRPWKEQQLFGKCRYGSLIDPLSEDENVAGFRKLWELRGISTPAARWASVSASTPSSAPNTSGF